MIVVTVPKCEVFDNKTNTFYVNEKEITLELEHSLASIQKWESTWHKPFLIEKPKTEEETFDYIRCMCLTPNISKEIFYCIPIEEMRRISDYIGDPMTATWFREEKNKPTGKKEIVTSEVIYYWMIALGIPMEYQYWHLNQLFTLIRVVSTKNSPKNKKKRSTREILAEHRAINEANKKRFHTKG